MIDRVSVDYTGARDKLAFTDAFGDRVNFNRGVPGATAVAEDGYMIMLDQSLNSEPDYVLGTFFWHVDGVSIDQPPPKATILSPRGLSDPGGATHFVNLYAAYEHFPDNKVAIDVLDFLKSPKMSSIGP